MKNKQRILAIVAAVVIAGVSFYAGTIYRGGRTANFQGRFAGNGQNGARGQFGQQAGAQGLRPVSGTIIKSDEGSVTIQLADGSSKIILLTGNSAINKTEAGSKADLPQGTEVFVFGAENSDGSITAQNVQIGTGFLRRDSQSQNPSGNQ